MASAISVSLAKPANVLPTLHMPLYCNYSVRQHYQHSSCRGSAIVAYANMYQCSNCQYCRRIVKIAHSKIVSIAPPTVMLLQHTPIYSQHSFSQRRTIIVRANVSQYSCRRSASLVYGNILPHYARQSSIPIRLKKWNCVQ